MKKTTFLFFFLCILTSFSACDNEETDTSGNNLLSQEDILAIFDALPPAGYSTSGNTNNLPGSYTGIYAETTINQNVTVSAVENLSGEVIEVTQSIIESNFLNPVNIQESEINGTKVYQSMEDDSYRAIIFKGQYLFGILVLNDPDPIVAEEEADKFLQIMTNVMLTF